MQVQPELRGAGSAGPAARHGHPVPGESPVPATRDAALTHPPQPADPLNPWQEGTVGWLHYSCQSWTHYAVGFNVAQANIMQ